MEWIKINNYNESVLNNNLTVVKYNEKVIDHQFKINSVMSPQLVTERLSSFMNVNESNYHIWLMSLLSASIIGLTGVFPLLILPSAISDNNKDKKQESNRKLKLMLSFSVGGLLGDVFLHLLPESWGYIDKTFGSPNQESLMFLGFWVLIGIFSFITIERLAVHFVKQSNNNDKINDKLNCDQKGTDIKSESSSFITGYLNLLANSVDNFAHGLAVGASFLVGIKIGLLTTFAIVAHEIPHELGDFAILIKSGFSRWGAVKAQISTASVGLLGAIVALSADSADQVSQKTLWILPFTAGGFLHIAMVNILPDILNEDNPWESTKQILCIMTGIAMMAMVNLFI